MIARLIALCGFAALALLVTPSARAQESATRFEISEVGDTTFTFRLGARYDWVRRGLTGIAVDQARRDLLIARFRVLEVRNGEATALITGQTAPVETTHVALLTRPRTPWYRQGSFWVGLLLGGAIGAGAASL